MTLNGFLLDRQEITSSVISKNEKQTEWMKSVYVNLHLSDETLIHNKADQKNTHL